MVSIRRPVLTVLLLLLREKLLRLRERGLLERHGRNSLWCSLCNRLGNI